MKRGEVDQLQHLEKQELQRQAEAKKKGNSEEMETDNSSSQFPWAPDDESSSSLSRRALPAAEVKRRLRAFGEPITVFGETDAQRLDRLKAVEMRSHERAHGSTGKSNSMKDLELEVAMDIQKATLEAYDKEKQGGVMTDEEKARLRREKRMEKYEIDQARKNFDCREEYSLHFFKRMLRLWERELNERAEEEKKTVHGKAASASQKQTRSYIRPLFKLLKNKECAQDVLRRLCEIVDECRKREYVNANESYLTLAIGNAAWPMGVTMVGIHERAGREKIFSQHVAHVLNDEVQRKYIQAVKRLMTYCQHRFPNVPSKNVE